MTLSIFLINCRLSKASWKGLLQNHMKIRGASMKFCIRRVLVKLSSLIIIISMTSKNMSKYTKSKYQNAKHMGKCPSWDRTTFSIQVIFVSYPNWIDKCLSSTYNHAKLDWLLFLYLCMHVSYLIINVCIFWVKYNGKIQSSVQLWCVVDRILWIRKKNWYLKRKTNKDHRRLDNWVWGKEKEGKAFWWTFSTFKFNLSTLGFDRYYLAVDFGVLVIPQPSLIIFVVLRNYF